MRETVEQMDASSRVGQTRVVSVKEIMREDDPLSLNETAVRDLMSLGGVGAFYGSPFSSPLSSPVWSFSSWRSFLLRLHSLSLSLSSPSSPAIPFLFGLDSFHGLSPPPSVPSCSSLMHPDLI